MGSDIDTNFQVIYKMFIKKPSESNWYIKWDFLKKKWEKGKITCSCIFIYYLLCFKFVTWNPFKNIKVWQIYLEHMFLKASSTFFNIKEFGIFYPKKTDWNFVQWV